MLKKILILVGILAIIIVVVVIFLRGNEDTWIKDKNGDWVKHGNPSAPAPVENFEECAKLYPVQESYPERCLTPDGKSFTKEY